MKCQNCGSENAENTNFCINCGQKIEAEMPTPDFGAPEGFELPAKENKFKKLLKNKIVWIAAAAVLVVVVLVAIIVGVSSCNKGTTIDMKDMPLFYSKDDEVWFLRNGQKKGQEFVDTEELGSGIKISADGKKAFFIYDKDLYMRKTTTKTKKGQDGIDAAIKIASDVDEYRLNSGCNKVVFVSDGDLCMCDVKENADVNKLAKNIYYEEYDGYSYKVTDDFKTIIYKNEDEEVVLVKSNGKTNTISKKDCYSFWFSENQKKVIFTESEDGEVKDLYTCGIGVNDEPVKIANGIDDFAFVDEKANELYYTEVERDDYGYAEESTLYYKKGKKAAERITDDFREFLVSHVDGKDTYYVVTVKEKDNEEVETLHRLNGKKLVEICDDFSTLYVRDDVVIVRQQEYDEDEGEYDRIYNILKKDKLYELDIKDDDGDWEIFDGKFYVIEDVDDEGYGTLVSYKLGRNGVERNKGVEICDDVSYFMLMGDEISSPIPIDVSVDKNMIIISAKDDECYVSYGKEAVELDKCYDYVWFNGKTVYYVTERDEDGVYSLYYFDGKKSKAIIEDVKQVEFFTDKYIYAINEDDDLLKVAKSGKTTFIDDDVEYIAGPFDAIEEVVMEDTEEEGNYGTTLIYTY